MFHDDRLRKVEEEVTKARAEIETLNKLIGHADPYALFWREQDASLFGRLESYCARVHGIEKWMDRVEDHLEVETVERKDGAQVFVEAGLLQED
jgi:hypothetical protein